MPDKTNRSEGSSRKYGLGGKIGGAFATVDYIHGGGELGIRTILDQMMVLGMLTYSGGGMQGRPVIHIGPVAVAGKLDDSKDTFCTYVQRMAMKTAEIFQWLPHPVRISRAITNGFNNFRRHTR